jgi:diguanylate cyclase (GGDEF)-like protein/PAS domain S-box-containing protein
MDDKINSDDLLLENEALRKELHSLTQIKEKLQKSNILFSQAEQFGNLGHWEWDEIADRYISCSEQYASIYGMTTKQILEEITSVEEVQSLVCEEDRERFKQVIGFALENKQGWNMEYSYYKAGQRVYLQEVGEPVFDDYGLIIKTIGTVQDITEKRLAEKGFRQSHALFQQAEAMGNMGHWSWDLVEDKLISCSDQFARIYGMTVPEALDCFISIDAVIDLIHPDDKELFRQSASFYKELRNGSDFEYRIVLSGNNTRHLYLRREVLLDNDGMPSQSFGTVLDITERKQAELRDKSHTHVLELISSGEPLPVILEAIVRIVEQENPTMLCSILLLDNAGKHLLSGAAPSLPDFYNDAIHGTEIGMGVGSCGTAAFINERVIVDDIQTHPYWKPYKELANKAQLGACWSEPIRAKKGQVLGTFSIYQQNVNYPTEADLAVIEKTAGLASIAIQKKQADLILESSENRLRLALAVTKQAWFDLNVQTGESLTSPEYAKLLGYDPADFKSDLQGWEDSLHPNDHEAVMSDFLKCLSQGSEFSTEYRRRKKNGGWLWFNTTAEILEWGSSQQPLRMIGIHAHFDVLTNLPNRVLLADRLSHAMVQCQLRKRSLAVAFLDLDGFKIINDTHGHHVGDELLIVVSQRMKKALREGDTLARIGGDEFIVVMVDLECIEDSKPILERLLKATAAPVTLDNTVMQLSASIGVTLYPQDGVDADQLTRQADQAMYVAKQAGKSRYHLFDTAQDNAIKVQREDIDNIRLALGRRDFVLHYQPKVNMSSGEVIGVEALIRWQHPDRGLVPPLEFLPVIEDQAIGLELGEWVIDTALSQISQWQSIGLQLPISVNISAYQLQQDNFTTRLTALLAVHPEVNPHHLELEILETSALSDISQVSATMNVCHALGVSFALDDFGTGYSSLTHLRRLPAYLIKIDQSFVRDMLEDTEDLAIIEGVIGLANTFQRAVIAEGVETIAHGVALLKLGCGLAQGYGIARPMPAENIPEWVSNWKADDAWRAYSPA